jgi:hypothetical protein
MHVAVEKTAPEGEPFLAYVEWLHEHHWLPPTGRGWVDYIRRRGNSAVHDIVIMTAEDSAKLVALTEALLRHVYELPGLVPPPAPQNA